MFITTYGSDKMYSFEKKQFKFAKKNLFYKFSCWWVIENQKWVASWKSLRSPTVNKYEKSAWKSSERNLGKNSIRNIIKISLKESSV